MLKTFSIAAVALALVTAAPATADEFSSSIRVQTTVTYADLDITREPGATALLKRIKHAAYTLCSPASLLARCVHTSMDRAVAKVGSPFVSEIYHGRNKVTSIATAN